MFVCDLAGDGRSDEYEWKPVLEFSNRKIAAIESLTRNLCRATQSPKTKYTKCIKMYKNV